MTAYYVSARTGNDSFDGTSPNAPLASLSAATARTFIPGDELLLERGSVFENQYLHITGSGSADKPLLIHDYGSPDAPAPAIHTNGSGIWHQDYRAPIGGPPHRNKGDVSTALLLKDVSHVEVRNLEVTNARTTDNDGLLFNDLAVTDRTGVAIIAENSGTVSHVVLENLFIHDVDGNIYNKHMANGGIYAMAHFPQETTSAIARFDDIQIRNNRVIHTSRWGIAVGYTAYLNYIDHGGKAADGSWNNTYDYGDGTIDDSVIAQYGATNVLIENNTVEDAGGDAITVMYCDRPIVRRNISRRAARNICDDIYTATDGGKVAAAIWPWRCKNALFENNEAYDTLNADNGNGDGQAWDADYGDGTVYRHNFSSGNSGGTVMFCNEKAINSEFAYNTAYHDAMGALDIPRNLEAWVHNNVFIMGENCDPLRNEGGRADGVATVEENVFINDAADSRDAEWHPGTSHVMWSNNRYLNFSNRPVEDDK